MEQSDAINGIAERNGVVVFLALQIRLPESQFVGKRADNFGHLRIGRAFAAFDCLFEQLRFSGIVFKMQVVVEDCTIFVGPIRYVGSVGIETADAVDQHDTRTIVGRKQLAAGIGDAVRFILSDRDRRLRNAPVVSRHRSVKIENTVAAQINMRGMCSGNARIIPCFVIDRPELNRTSPHREAAEQRIFRSLARRGTQNCLSVCTELERSIVKRVVRCICHSRAVEVAKVNRALLKRESTSENDLGLLIRERKVVVGRSERDLNATALSAQTVLKYTAKRCVVVVVAVNGEQRILGNQDTVAGVTTAAAENIEAVGCQINPSPAVEHQVAEEVALRTNDRQIRWIVVVVHVAASDNFDRAGTV